MRTALSSTVSASVTDFFSKGKSFSHPAKTVLIHAGSSPSGVFFLQSGVVKQTIVTDTGAEAALNLFRPGAFFPLTWGLNKIPNRHTFIAVTPVTGFTRSAKDVALFLKQNPPVLFDLTTRLISGLDALLTKTELLMVETATGRLVQTLLKLSDRFQLDSSTETTINLKLTHQALADLTGLSRETVTRELNRLSDQKLLSIRHGFISLDVEKLQALAEL